MGKANCFTGRYFHPPPDFHLGAVDAGFSAGFVLSQLASLHFSQSSPQVHSSVPQPLQSLLSQFSADSFFVVASVFGVVASELELVCSLLQEARNPMKQARIKYVIFLAIMKHTNTTE